MKKICFPQKFSEKVYSGHVEGRVDYRIEKSFDKIQKIFRSSSEQGNLFSSRKIVKRFLWTRKCSYDNPAEQFSLGGQRKFAHCPKKSKKTFFANKLFLLKCSFGQVKSSFDNLFGCFQQKADRFSLKVLK